MGTSSSIVKSADDGKQSTELCDSCGKGEANVCTECEKPVCDTCCPHKHNVMFEVKPVPLKNNKLKMNDVKHLKMIEAKCGVYTHSTELHVIGEAVYEDTKSREQSTQWGVYNLADDKTKPGIVTKRYPMDERSLRFPGDTCSSVKFKHTYFTVPCKKMVFMYKKHSSFYECFPTAGSCFGIACFAGGFAVSMEIKSNFNMPSAWQVQTFDEKGKLKKQFFYDSSGDALFKRPLFLDSNKSETTLFVSDIGKRAIIALDVEGTKLFEFVNAILNEPLGIAVDPEENIYVACGSRVVQVEKGGVSFRELLPVGNHDKAVDICFEPVENLLTVILKSGAVTTVSLQK